MTVLVNEDIVWLDVTERERGREGEREGGREGGRSDERQRVKGRIQNEGLGLIVLHVQVCTYMYIHVQ